MKKGKFFFLIIINFSSVNLFSQFSTADSIFRPDSLRAIIEFLAANSLQGRLNGSDGCKKAAIFIAKEFKQAGLKPIEGDSGFFMPVNSKWGNVVGAIAGKSKPEEVIIFSAHYDHIGTISTNPYPFTKEKIITAIGDTIYNGANDDASGVSAVISLAKYFVKQNNNERTLIFVAFAGEELGDIGSAYFASLTNPILVKAVINIEMIGRKDFGDDRPYMTGSELSDLYEILNKQLFEEDKAYYKRHFILRDPFPGEQLFMRSDNYPFAKLGIPAHTIMTTPPTDEYYHSLGDEASTLDYSLISRITKAIAIGCRSLVTGKDTPRRIN